MKKRNFYFVAVLTALLVFSISANTFAQGTPSFTHKTTTGFDVNSGVETTEHFYVDDLEFKIYVTHTGSKYVKATSKKGNLYPVWIFEKTDYTFEGNTVYKSKKGSYCIYKLSVNKTPYPSWLDTK